CRSAGDSIKRCRKIVTQLSYRRAGLRTSKPSRLRQCARLLVLLGGNSAWSGICHDQNVLNLYPWFNLLNEKGMKGIRESQGSQGEPFNLRQAEIIIGQGVTNAINGIMNVNQAVEYINARIRNETGA
ncbi:hypothetical protein ACUOA5_37725, partial [Escherichia coli]